jgi:hypothetical protein
MRAGRLTPLANLGRRLLGLVIFQLSMVTSTPIVVFHALAKLVLIAAGIAACVAFLKSLRWRQDSGDDLVRASPATLAITAGILLALIAVGVASHQQFRNGWVSYPLLTYGGITVVFGSAALTVHVARRLAQEKRGAAITAVAASILLGAILNWTYELYYVGVLLSLFALMAFPLTTKLATRAERRAKVIVGSTLGASFLIGFVLTRALVAGVCSGEECYAGTTIALGSATFRTAWYNLVSIFPGASGQEVRRDLESIDPGALKDGIYVGELWLVGLALGAAVWILWRWASSRWLTSTKEKRGESRLLLMAACGSGIVAVGSCVIMSISVQSQEVIDRIGIPYRHTVLAWFAFSVSLVLIVRSIELGARKLNAWLAVALLCCGVVAASIYTLPRNVLATRLYRTTPANVAISQIHWEVVAGDPHPGGDQRRCQTLRDAEAAISNPWLKARLEPATDQLFRRLYGLPYCSTWSG